MSERVNFRGLKKVEIEWIDSCASKGWGSRDFHLKEFATSSCRSTGYVIEDNKKYLAIAQSISDDTHNISDLISIPKVAITKVKILK